MKKKELQQLLSIIPDIPAMNLFHISDGKVMLCEALEQLCKQNDYYYDLVTVGDEYLQILDKFGVRKISFDKNRYNYRSKLYDFAFVEMDLDRVPDLEIFFNGSVW